MKTALVIGAGPAGLMAAEEMARAGLRVTICDAKPSFGRKFLMAGKSGLNLTKDEPFDALVTRYGDRSKVLGQILRAFDAGAVQDWARGLGQEVFTGSTGRVFPVAMKASPLLRAWLARLDGMGVERRTRWRWTGWDGAAVLFDTPEGRQVLAPDVTVLALGGASWARLGSDGQWAEILQAEGIDLAPFAPSNVGLLIRWSDPMRKHFGAALKGVAFRAGDTLSRGEAVISAQGIEGGGLYPLSPALRGGAPLKVDLIPDLSAAEATARLASQPAKNSLSNRLRKGLKMDPIKIALAQEVARPLPQDVSALAALLKALPLPYDGLRPMDEAISTAGGVAFTALDDGLMLRARPGTFCAGEMLDWDAPTGGYLITACLATGRWAGQAAARWIAT